MLKPVKFSGFTKMKAAQQAWSVVKDVDLYPYTDGNGVVMWIWTEGHDRKKPTSFDFVGPHGKADLWRLISALQDALIACETPAEHEAITPAVVEEASDAVS